MPVVEDDEATRAFLLDNLAADGFRVAGASGAGEGLRAIEVRQPALVVLDLLLEDGNGLGLLDRVPAADGLSSRIEPDLSVIVLGGRGGDADRVRSFARGADGHLNKPTRSLFPHWRAASPAARSLHVRVYRRLSGGVITERTRGFPRSMRYIVTPPAVVLPFASSSKLPRMPSLTRVRNRFLVTDARVPSEAAIASSSTSVAWAMAAEGGAACLSIACSKASTKRRPAGGEGVRGARPGR